jgi:hypothetical protein
VSWPVYSERLIRVKDAQTAKTYTVPQGHRAVVRSIVIVNYSGLDGYVNCQVDGHCVCLVIYPGEPRNFVRDLRAVAYAGDVLTVITNAAHFHVTMWGYIFRDPSGHVGPPSGPTQLPALEPIAPPGGVDA